MTDATLQALDGLRDLSMVKWYIIPILMTVFYIYAKEIRLARSNGNWDAVFAGLTLFGVDFFNETCLRTMIGWNIEIIFMFLLGGIVYYYTLSESTTEKIMGIPEKWFWAIGYSVFAVFIECLLNIGGHLVWEYPFWNLSFKGVWLIFFFGYFHFYCAIIFMLSLKMVKNKIITLSVIYAIPAVMNIIALGFLGWNY